MEKVIEYLEELKEIKRLKGDLSTAYSIDTCIKTLDDKGCTQERLDEIMMLDSEYDIRDALIDLI